MTDAEDAEGALDVNIHKHLAVDAEAMNTAVTKACSEAFADTESQVCPSISLIERGCRAALSFCFRVRCHYCQVSAHMWCSKDLAPLSAQQQLHLQ
jgi:hypothetical protein